MGFSELCSNGSYWSSFEDVNLGKRANPNKKHVILYENNDIGFKIIRQRKRRSDKKFNCDDSKWKNIVKKDKQNSRGDCHRIDCALWGEGCTGDHIEQEEDYLNSNTKVPSTLSNVENSHVSVVSSLNHSIREDVVMTTKNIDEQKTDNIIPTVPLAVSSLSDNSCVKSSEPHPEPEKEILSISTNRREDEVKNKVSLHDSPSKSHIIHCHDKIMRLAPVPKLVAIPSADSRSFNRYKATQSENWLDMFRELCRYREKSGSCNVPKNCPINKKLGQWVRTQRLQYKKYEKGHPSQITPERLKMLSDIGFKWELRKRSSTGKMVPWQHRFDQLVEYKKIHGTCNEIRQRGSEENIKLAHWVVNQRNAYKVAMSLKEGGGSMSKERIELLESIGFEWTRQPGKKPRKKSMVKSQKGTAAAVKNLHNDHVSLSSNEGIEDINIDVSVAKFISNNERTI